MKNKRIKGLKKIFNYKIKRFNREGLTSKDDSLYLKSCLELAIYGMQQATTEEKYNNIVNHLIIIFKEYDN